MMASRVVARAAGVAMVAACLASVPRAAQYPLTITLDAKAAAGDASVTGTVSVRVDRLMEENRRQRVTDALKFSGYGNALTALRALPPIGTIGVNKRSVQIKFATEQPDGAGRRLLLVADRPLFFLAGDPSKDRTGYELTVVDLRIDAQGGVTGTMSGAARVKPSPDGVVLGDFAEAPVQLTGKLPTP